MIQQHQNGNHGMFYVGEEIDPLATMTYTMATPEKMIINHTEVSDELSGKNVGLQLVNKAVEYARMSNIKIIPLCPYAKSVFDRRPELRDVLD
jgi:uncharacterized protein